MMRLPNEELAIIEAKKLHDYLLSPIHPVGRFKAIFFEKLGYSQENWSKLEQDLRSQHLLQTLKKLEPRHTGENTKFKLPLKVRMVNVYN